MVSWYSHLQTGWTTGDEYALSLQVELFGDDDDKPSEPIGSPAELEVKWKR